MNIQINNKININNNKKKRDWISIWNYFSLERIRSQAKMREFFFVFFVRYTKNIYMVIFLS